jgi:hypothetical protein
LVGVRNPNFREYLRIATWWNCNTFCCLSYTQTKHTVLLLDFFYLISLSK